MENWFITGISGGLGRALAEAALAAGHRVFGTTRRLHGVSGWPEDTRDRVRVVALDVTDEAAVHQAVAAAEAWTGGLDVVVNNAGYGLTGAIEETSLRQVRDIFDVNLMGALAVIQAVLPRMRHRRRGHIVNITSVSGLAAWSGTGIYGATKFALECVGRTLADEVRPLGIRVTNVAPGGLRTAFAGASLLDAAGDIADYRDTAHQARQILTGHRGAEPNDTVLAAQAVLAAVAAENPPLSLLLGRDALGYAQAEQERLGREWARWVDVTHSVTARD